MAGIRAYTLADVLKQMNDQGLETVTDNPNEVVNVLAAPNGENVKLVDAVSASLYSGIYVWGPPGTGKTALVWNLGQWG